MKKIIGLILIMSAVVVSCKKENTNTPTQQQIISDSLDVVRVSIGEETGNVVPSLSVYIQTPDETLFVTSQAEGETPQTADTYFRFASNSKNFTSTAILNMYEEGWLDIYSAITDTIPDTDVTYVPDTPQWNIPFKSQITIERLLQHGAGVYDVDNDPVPDCDGMSYTEYTMASNPNHQFEVDELVEQLGKYDLYYWEPGEDYHYSNTGYSILSEIIARVYTEKSGSIKTFKDYLYDFIYGHEAIVPLSVGFPDLATEQELPDPHAIGNTFFPANEGGDVQYNATNVSAHVAEGNGYGTFIELNKYVRSLMTGNNVLEPSTIELMQTDYGPGSSSYGLGCITFTDMGYGHNGEIRGYLSIMAYDPEYDVSMVVMMNAVNYTSEENYLTNFKGMYMGAWKVREMMGLSYQSFKF